MRAVIFRQHSASLDVYEISDDLPVPAVGAGEVLIRVTFAALNRLDDFVRRGWPSLRLQMPHIGGSDFSGRIAQVGPGVEGWRVGQQVTGNPLVWCGRCGFCMQGQHNLCVNFRLLGEHIPGAYAEYVTLPAANLIAIPDGYDMGQAAAASLVYVTAWHSLLTAGDLRAGERMLIVGAGGGVNGASLQIGKLAGARVYVVAGDARKARLAEAQGADWVWDRSRHPDWGKAVYAATNRRGVDVVVDNVGAATWTASLRALRSGGRLLTVGGTSGYAASVPVNYIFGKQVRIIGSTLGTQADYAAVMEQVFQKRLQPIVDSVYAMVDYRLALGRMLDSAQFGKILLAIG